MDFMIFVYLVSCVGREWLFWGCGVEGYCWEEWEGRRRLVECSYVWGWGYVFIVRITFRFLFLFYLVIKERK